jgi:hypothetical protein
LSFGALIESVGFAIVPPTFELALYDDDSGEPDDRIAVSESVPLVAGTLSLPPRDDDRCISVEAGTYWLIGSATAMPVATVYSIGLDPSGGTLPLVTRPRGTRIPSSFPMGGSTETGSTQPLNFFLVLD